MSKNDQPSQECLRRQDAGCRTKTAIIYPWDDLAEGRSGSASLVLLHIKYLVEKGHDVRVLQMGKVSAELSGRAYLESYDHAKWRSPLLRRVLSSSLKALGASKLEAFHVWYFLWPRLDNDLQKTCADLIGWADEVYLEYAYFASFVTAQCQAQNKTLVVTMHDVISDLFVGNRLLQSIAEIFEFAHLKKCAQLVCLTQPDFERLASRGLTAFISKPSIDILAYACAGPVDASDQIALFIGSSHPPNIAAAQEIERLAEQCQLDADMSGLRFIVAGSCMAQRQSDNFTSLGPVPHGVLTKLYQEATWILVPLRSGTGVSVKTIEALGRGKVIISTRCGVRGLPVSNGVHCIVEDDIESWPTRIGELRRDNARVAELQRNALEFASTYHYEVVFSEADKARAGAVGAST